VISWHFVSNALRERRAQIAFACVFAGLFQVLIVALVIGANLLVIVEQFYSQMPPQVQVLFGEQFIAQFSVNGAVALGYVHPLVLVLLAVVAISIPARQIAGEIENGTLELLFAMPVKRSQVALSQWLFCAFVLLVLVVGCWVGTGVGLALYPDVRSVPLANVAKIGVNLWLLMVAVASYTMLLAAYSNEGSKVALRAGGITWFFYFANVLLVMWPDGAFLRRFTLFHYHEPPQIMMNSPVWGRNVLVLVSISVVCAALAIRRMARRDIPG